MPKVSVVTIYYNRADLVRRSVESLLAQSLGDIEVIVVDDGSNDGTADEVAKFSDPRLIYVRQENAGFVRSINRAVRMARSEYVAVHGSGDISLPERLAAQAEALDRLPDVGIVTCGIKAGNCTVQPAGQSEAVRLPLLETLKRRNPLDHGAVMFRRSVFDRVGGYREAFRYAQDYDLWLRMGRLVDYAVVPDLLYERFFLADGVSGQASKFILQKKFSKFALQCALNLDRDGRDWLDRYGEAAFLLANPSRRTALSLAKDGLRWLRDGKVEGARALLHAAVGEQRTPLTRFGAYCARLDPEGWIWRWLTRPVLRLVTSLSQTEGET